MMIMFILNILFALAAIYAGFMLFCCLGSMIIGTFGVLLELPVIGSLIGWVIYGGICLTVFLGPLALYHYCIK